ncbi:ParB/RepB/Spo0J family partition protein [Sphaerimonospora thailandensis]|uniref:ParB family chromosome partitioning protein n=1 Tax=Sphaerimonospora thailandensis TaxID=795644 RepID=A0A8J3R4K6_9ACTN|nr:hypothetical protein [Sphaerimonospora thailandensis]GIH68363.1 hypothetical protein Mth01_06160 [Sphaerimonospora thailandensis]
MSTTTVAEWETDLREAEGLRLVRIPLKFLDHHPGNVRSDFALTEAFCQSLAAEQQVPVHVIPIPADHERAEGEEGYRFWVTKGNRRLAAARSTQLPDLLCLIDLAKAGDRAGLFIDMVVENDDDYRHGLTAFEQAQALFEAHHAGASRTRLQKVTGRSRQQIAEALTVGGLSATTQQGARQMDYEWTLEDLALLAEFDGDEEGLAEIHERLRWGGKVRYVVERVRTERAEAAEHARLRAELEESGITVTEQLPPGALTLARLADAVDGFDPETHATCGGHGVYFRSFDKTTPVAYCTTPDQHGHAVPASPVVTGTAEPAKGEDLERRLVIEGNRAWKASAVVRQEWVAALLARTTARAKAGPGLGRPAAGGDARPAAGQAHRCPAQPTVGHTHRKLPRGECRHRPAGTAAAAGPGTDRRGVRAPDDRPGHSQIHLAAGPLLPGQPRRRGRVPVSAGRARLPTHADRAGDYRRCAVPWRRTHGRGTGVRPVGRRHGRQRPVAAPG